MKKKTLTQVPLKVSVHVRYLYQEKDIREKELLKMYPKLSKVTIYRRTKKPVADKTVNKRNHNHGRPRKISPRDKRLILYQIALLREQYGFFTIKRLTVSAGVRKDVSDETVRRVLRRTGYQFLHSRKKSLLKKVDLKKRRKFARKVTKILSHKFWEEGISFYIDAAGFQHKYKPHHVVRSIRTMAWRLKNDGLHRGLGRKITIFHWQFIKKVLFYANSMKTKLMETCSQILPKHNFKKLSVDAGFQKAKGFLKMDILYKTVKRQDKFWIQLKRSNLAYSSFTRF